MRVFQFLGANVTEHDSKREEAEQADHQQDVHHALGLSRDSVVHGLLGSVVQRYYCRRHRCSVQAVLQEGEQQGLQLSGVDV